MEYICNYCGKNFGNHKTEYRAHIKVCTEKPLFYKCQYCGKKFIKKGSCVNHELHQCNKNLNKIEYQHVCNFPKNGVPSKEGGWTCICGKNFKTRKLLLEHKKTCKVCHPDGDKNFQAHPKFTATCPYCGLTKTFNQSSFSSHKNHCKKNPNRVPFKSHSPSEETKKKTSASMKKAQAEGRAWNIGQSRWNNEPSYPEKWFMKMLKNEFNLIENKDYVREKSFHRFSLDFAWPERKLCIEIDGKQHFTDQKQMERDKRKDELLKKEGWKEMRIKWLYLFNNPKIVINNVKNFLKS